MNGKTPTGVTALSAAVLKRHTSVVRPLLAAGADVHVRDPAGETPILLAAKFEGSVPPGGVVAGTPGPPPGATMPGRRPPRPPATRSRSSWRCCSRPGPIRTRPIVRGATLMFAAAQGRVELVQVLLAGGADVEAKAANGKTAWQVATGEEVMRVLQAPRARR